MREFFPRLYGNEKTKERIGRAVLDGTLPHAFLIVGPLGSGKSTLAREISASLNCENAKNESLPLPCGICNCCKRIYEGNFPDVKILAKAKDKATLGVDPIKDFREDMFLSATESDYKIYIVDDGECMTPEAQNALLKVFEEPPEQVLIMILATEGDKILTTIKSRAQHIAMSRFSDSTLAEHLLTMSSDARDLKRESTEKFNGVIISSGGVLGTAIRLSDKKLAAECEKEREEIFQIVKAIISKRSYKDIREALELLPQKKNDRQQLLSYLEKITSALRDCLACKESESAPLIFFSSKDTALSLSSQISARELLKIYDTIEETHRLCTMNANLQNLVSSLGAKLKLM